MFWGMILISGMVLIVILLSTLFGGEEKKKKRARSFELDEFLEGTRRRQEKDEPARTPPLTEPGVAPPPIIRDRMPTVDPLPSVELPDVPAPRLPVRQRRTSPVVRNVRRLLSDPASIKSAFVLNEIFGRPTSRKR